MNPPFPSMPAGWNKTIADLFDEVKRGERPSVGSPEVDWAREYERSLIPPDMRFPRKGDVYEALEDMTVQYLTSWAAPYTGSGEGLLRKGDRVWVDTEPHDSRAISTYAVAVDYEALEQRLVSAADRKSPKYSGFYFSFGTVELNRKFRLVGEAGESPGLNGGRCLHGDCGVLGEPSVGSDRCLGAEGVRAGPQGDLPG